MGSFAFIVCPKTIQELKNLKPVLKFIPNFILKPYLKNTPPFKLLRIKKISSIQGKEIQGYFIASGLLNNGTQELGEEVIIDKIIEAGRVAERLGANIVGLDGCISNLTDKEQIIAKKLKIPITSGDTFTAWAIFEAIYRTARTRRIDLNKSTLAIIDAITSVGNLCARKLANYVSRIILVSGSQDKLARLKETILHLNPIEIIIEEDAHKAIKEADIVVTANNSPEVIMSRYNMVIKAGLVRLPYPSELGLNTGLPKGIISAALAETMLLTFEGRFVDYSLGDNINLDKLEEIADICVQHGFEIWVPEAPVI